MNTPTDSAPATVTPCESASGRLYYYRPLAHRPGVFKCAGYGAEDAGHRAFFEVYYRTHGDDSAGIAAGNPIIRSYAGDLIGKDSEPLNG